MKLSIVIPLYNEEECIPILYKELITILESLNYDYEIIFIDDASKDDSLKELKKIKVYNPNVKIISFQENYGQSTALRIGFERAQGDVVITIDADLQSDPRDIPRLLSFLEEGYDVVSGWRRKRQDSFKKRFASKLANWIRNKILKDEIKDIGCMLKAYRRSFLNKLKLYNGFHRFLPVVLKLEGAKVIEVEVNHRKRKFGKSKYGITNRLFKPLIDTFIVLWMRKNYPIPKIKEEL